jgi:hypothetical protein
VRNVTDELEGASTGKWTWGVGDIAADPIRLAPTPVDVAKAQHLVSAENPAFASVTKVFSYLAAKVATLKQEVGLRSRRLPLVWTWQRGGRWHVNRALRQRVALRFDPKRLSAPDRASEFCCKLTEI